MLNSLQHLTIPQPLAQGLEYIGFQLGLQYTIGLFLTIAVLFGYWLGRGFKK